nr:protein kinase [Wenzhouxiangella sp. XN79A]
MLGGAYSGIRPIRGGPNDNVYVAFDNNDRNKVFIKLVDGNRYRRELNVFALPVRDQIVAPLDTVFIDNTRCALIYPWFSSGSLRKWLRRRSIWSPDLVKRLAHDLMVALRCLHAQRMLHSDLKPENILVRRDGSSLRFFLADFGSSAYFQEVEQQKWRSASPAYEAPESVDGHPSLRSDLFSLGIVLLEALRGSVPNRGMPSAIYREARYTIPELSGVPCLALRNLLSRLLQNDERNRPEHASEALALLMKGASDDRSVLPRSATVVPAGLVKRHARSHRGPFDTVLSSDDGRFVAFHAGCNLVVREATGRTIGSVSCSSVSPIWHGDELYFVQGSDLWQWCVEFDRLSHVRWLRHVPDAIAVAEDGEAWLSNNWLFCASRGSADIARTRLEGFVNSDLIALTTDRCYVIEGNLQDRLVCRDRNLVVRWSRDLDGMAEGLRVSQDGSLRLLLRSVQRPVSFEAQTIENGICRQRIALDPGTRNVSLTRNGCIAWLQSGQVRLYSFSETGRVRRQWLSPLRLRPRQRRSIEPSTGEPDQPQEGEVRP